MSTEVADPLAGYAGFAAALREAGVACNARRVQAYLSAVAKVDVAQRVQLYWAGRLTLCSDPDDLARYEEAFARWFEGADRPNATAGTPVKKQARIAPLVAAEGGDGDSAEAAHDTLRVAASDHEILRHRDLADLTKSERAHLRELLATLRPVLPKRRAARRASAHRGALDPARTLRAMLAAGGEPVRLAHYRRGTRARKVVLLIDVSGSMSPYADALLRFAHVVARSSPMSVEVFTLGTRMTRVSRQLRQRDPEQAMLAAGTAVPDFAGGTRLGETLRVFLDRWGQRGFARRAVVTVFSDGWERGDVSLLSEQLGRLRRLAHAVFWVNPHAGRDGYAPVQSGIVAALPHIDRLLAGHSLATLERLLGEIADA
ncbi:vWA domain-containing protein [Amycolatopsis benzoatilytica]|uniref:vWA domain-containing protein n=1 Tax=Amycolatopsis benzoatilytica TaxID=346045 RepID=UPI000371BEB2|nr:VWA domain-containing protein [Amycolatopsis benzoatilytica]